MQVRVLGAHNLETDSTHHTCFLVDGVLAIDAGSLVSTLARDEQLALRHVLLTHLHFDHTRDIPTLGLQTLDEASLIDVYSLSVTLESVRAHLMDTVVYPDLSQPLNARPAALRFLPINDADAFTVGEYTVKPIPVLHPVPTVGYIVRSGDECIAYTGDTGGRLLPFMQDDLPPSTLFVDLTYPNELEWRAEVAGHLTPDRLKAQLQQAIADNVTLPKIVPVHMSQAYEKVIMKELAIVERELGVDLEPGFEGMIVG